MAEVDIVVVGAGPAGAAAAIAAAQEGLRCIVLDAGSDLADQPGETLHPGAELLFRRLGVDDAIGAAAPIRHEGHWSDWSGRREFVRFGADENGAWRGFQIRRKHLRQILMRRVEEVGVPVRRGRATRPLLRGSLVCGVETSEDTIGCRILIDASGGSLWSARTMHDPIEHRSPPLVAWYGWATSHLATRFAQPILTFDREGWCWIAQVGENVCAWTRLNFRSGGTARLQKPPLLDGFTEVGRERGADVTWRTVAAPARDGVFRVGDAAGVLDPASSHGVLRALMSGLAAARNAARVLRSAHCPPAEAAAYSRWLRGMLIRDANALRILYQHGKSIRRANRDVSLRRFGPIGPVAARSPSPLATG